MPTIATIQNKIIFKDGGVSCECCEFCVSASQYGNGGEGNRGGPCRDFLTTKTDKVQIEGLYSCVGSVDDAAQISWPGGTFSSPAAQPWVGPCYGAHAFSFNAMFKEDDIVTCTAGSWGIIYGCQIKCCYISAP